MALIAATCCCWLADSQRSGLFGIVASELCCSVHATENNVKSTCTHANVCILHNIFHLWGKVVLPKDLECSCILTVESLRHAVLTHRLPFIACANVTMDYIEHQRQVLTLSSTIAAGHASSPGSLRARVGRAFGTFGRGRC